MHGMRSRLAVDVPVDAGAISHKAAATCLYRVRVQYKHTVLALLVCTKNVLCVTLAPLAARLTC
jgi:hypothetical protein